MKKLFLLILIVVSLCACTNTNDETETSQDTEKQTEIETQTQTEIETQTEVETETEIQQEIETSQGSEATETEATEIEIEVETEIVTEIVHAVEINAENFPTIDGSTATIPIGNALKYLFTGEDSPVEFNGTSTSYDNLSYANADLVIAYEPTEWNNQLEYAPIGSDALVFLINANNPVKSLTTQQIIDIYAGNVSNWKDVGGPDTSIKAFQRNYNSGSQTLMQKLVMKDIPMAGTEVHEIISEMGEMVDVIANYANEDFAIGYNVYYYVTSMKIDERIQLLSVDGVMPGSNTISSGEYPFVNNFYAAIRKDSLDGSPERMLYNWLTETDGQKLIENLGYVPIAK